MSGKKLNLKTTRNILSTLECEVKNSLQSDVEEIVALVATYKGTMLDIQLKISKMIGAIDAGQFPDDKQLYGRCMELTDISVPSTSEHARQIREAALNDLYSVQTAVTSCFDRMVLKLTKAQSLDDDIRSLAMVNTTPSVCTNHTEAVQNVDKSAVSSETVTPVRAAAVAPFVNVDDSVTKPRPIVAVNRMHLPLADGLRNSDVQSFLGNKNHDDEADIEAELQESSSFEDEITPFDSVSNVGSPCMAQEPHPIRISFSDLSNCAKIVVPRRTFKTADEDIRNVSCEWIENQFHPYNFWLRVLDDKYDQMAKEISDMKSHIKVVPVDSVVVKLYCLAKYHNEWYRAYVTKISPDAVTVVFIDYGNFEIVSFREIGQLPHTMASLPWQAFRVALFGIKPEGANLNPNKSNAWKPAALDYLKRCFQQPDVSFECRVKSAPEKRPAIVDIRMATPKKDFILLRKELVKKQQVAVVENLLKQEELLAIVDDSLNQKNMAGDTKAARNATGHKAPTIKTLSSVKSQASAKSLSSDSPSINSPAPAVSEQEDFRSVDVSLSGTAVISAFNAVPVAKGHAIDYCLPLPLGPELKVGITEFPGPDDFFVVAGESLLQGKLLVDQELAQSCVESKKHVPATAGRLILYKSSKRSIYCRGKIVKIDQNGTLLDVLDIDSGVLESARYPEDVGQLPAEFCKFNRAAIRVSLDTGNTEGSVTLRSDFENFFKLRLAGRQLIAKPSPKALPEKAALYRSCSEPMPILIYLAESNNRRIFLGDLILTTKELDASVVAPFLQIGVRNNATSNKADNIASSSDDDDEDELIPPANPDLFLLGYEPKDDALVCKFYSKGRACPRGQYCSFRHDILGPYRTTTEFEIFGKVETVELASGSRVFVRLPSDWADACKKALNANSANLVSIWCQLPMGTEDWSGKEENLLHVVEECGDNPTDFENEYVSLEAELTNAYNSTDAEYSRRTPHPLIPMETMYAAVRVSGRILGDELADDQMLFWVRGFVEETLRDDCHAIVRLLDYGNQTVISAEHIRPLEPSFADRLPAMSILVHVERSLAERLLQTEPADCVLIADVKENDPVSFDPIVDLLQLKRGKSATASVTKI